MKNNHNNMTLILLNSTTPLKPQILFLKSRSVQHFYKKKPSTKSKSRPKQIGKIPNSLTNNRQTRHTASKLRATNNSNKQVTALHLKIGRGNRCQEIPLSPLPDK